LLFYRDDPARSSKNRQGSRLFLKSANQ
jgi:hypothetical protein